MNTTGRYGTKVAPFGWDCSMYHPLSTTAISGKQAVIVLNYHLPSNLESYWKTNGLKICADGGAQRLFLRNKELIPDAIKGDFDSVPPDVVEYYRKKNVAIYHDPDQNTTDLQKCIKFLELYESQNNVVHENILVLGGLGGCLSHTFANLNTLYLYQQRKVVLIGRKNMAILISKGKSTYHFQKLDTVIFCSLVPLGDKVGNVTTTGLKWNLVNQSLTFGGMVSTSNQMEEEMVTIQTDQSLLWILDFVH